MRTPFVPACVVIAHIALLSWETQGDEKDERISELERRLESMEQKHRLLEDKLDGRDGKNREKPEVSPTLSIGSSGFILRSADTNFVLRLRGLIQLDSRTYVDDGGINANDSFVLRRARPILEGTVFRNFDFLLNPDFAPATPRLRDAWLNYRYQPGLQARVGQMKVSAGLERLQSGANTLFLERSLVSHLMPNRDLGIMLHGELWEGEEAVTKRLGWSGVFNYAVGVFNGVGDARSSRNSEESDDEKSGAARIFLQPFLRSKLKPLQGLGFGIGASYGDGEGASLLPAESGFATEGQQSFFRYAAGTIADGEHWRLVPQAYYYCGPFGLLGEYAVSAQRLRRTAVPIGLTTAHHTAWQVTGSYLLTGEPSSFRGVTPRKNFHPIEGSWGALELVVRYSYLDVDNGVFPIFASPAMSATRAAGWGVGLNWYLNKNVRAAVNFLHTDFRGGNSGIVSRPDENLFLTRVQLAF